MQSVTIIADDGMVYVDGAALKVDLTTLDPTIHALQWNAVTEAGEIEFRTEADGSRKPNKKITDLSPFQNLLDLHQTALAAQQAAAAAAAAQAASAKAASAKAAKPGAPVNVIAN